MTFPDKSGVCPSCGTQNDPAFRFCVKCGTELPSPVESKSPQTAHSSGRKRGIEPDPDALMKEPRYTGGHGAESADESSEPGSASPLYATTDRDSSGKKPEVSIEQAPSSGLIILLLLTGILLPPVGIITAVIWLFNKKYRRASLPTFLAAILGASLWGWGIYADIRSQMYESPRAVLSQYISAQDWAFESSGHYMPLVELKIKGYLPPDFPRPESLEYSLVEHVIGPTGYLVEIKPGTEENSFFRMQSLWTDNTGEVKLGSRTGPRLAEPSE